MNGYQWIESPDFLLVSFSRMSLRSATQLYRESTPSNSHFVPLMPKFEYYEVSTQDFSLVLCCFDKADESATINFL